MKKIFGIILAICCLGSAFAGNPTENYSIAEFSGEAGVKYVQNLDYKADTNKFGFENWANANLKINLLNGGNVTTKGKGIWGEIKVKIDTPDALENPGALSIGKSAFVDYAKIHFLKGDVGIALNITAPKNELGTLTLPSAIPASYSTGAINKAYSNGFGLEIRNYLVDLDLIYNTNGVKKADALKHSFGVNSTIKGFINTNIYVGLALKDKDLSYRIGGDHNLTLSDKMYVKPAIDFNYEARGDLAVSKMIAGVLFGWGNKGVDAGFDLDDTDDGKYNEGVSVSYETTLSKHDFKNGVYGKLIIGAFENSLVSGLATAVKYETTVEKFIEGTASLNTKYSKDFGVVGVTVEGEAVAPLAAIKTTTLGYSVSLWNNNIIKNTNLWAKYVGTTSCDGATNKGDIEIGAKIHF